MTKTEPLRLLVITTIPQTMAAFFEKQLRIMAEQGFEVHAVSSPGEALDRLDAGDSVIKHGLLMERKPSPWQDVKSLWAMLRLMRRVRPHIVHAHTPKAGLLGMLAARMAGVPVRLYTVHGLPLETRTGAKRKILEYAERVSAFCSTTTYSVSHSVREIVVKFRLCGSGKVSVLGDGSCAGVDLSRFRPSAGLIHGCALRRANQIPDDAPVAVFIGRLSKDKGVEVLAEAWPDVIRRNPKLRLIIAGELDETDRISDEAMRMLTSDSKIVLLGNIAKTGIPSVYEAATFVVLPTFREGLSQVALECGAMGVPLVSTRVCGLDAVVDGRTGLLVPPRNASALADAIVRMAGDETLRERLGRSAREHVAACYSEARVNQLWIGEYRRLVRATFPGLRERVARQVEG